MLHITNGDSAGQTIGASALGGAWLAWKDVLQEGPVLAGLALADLSVERARFIASQGWGDAAAVAADFAARDATLASSLAQDEVVLWFEHDLYDQLQLIQLLDWFAGHDLGQPGAARLSLICVDSYPGKARFLGLGELTAAELVSLFPARHAVTPAELALGRAAWAAFRAPDPMALETLLGGDTSALPYLPYLRAALLRHLEEYPAVGDGLARAERELLQVIAAGEETPRAIFAAQQALEQAPYMGDLPLWSRLRDLGAGPRPLIALADGRRFLAPHEAPDPDQFAAQRVTLTDDGRAVLARQADYLALNGIERWLGGVHLRAGAPLWRWDAAAQRLVRV
jgi:hypothetical protein